MPIDPKKPNLIFFKPDLESDITIPFFNQGVPAGFPSPALDFMENSIDLNKALSDNPLATFFIKVDGNSMIDAGIENQDVLVVDRSLEPENNKIAICFIDGEFTVKRIKIQNHELWLIPENKAYQPLLITQENHFLVWGIVTYVIKKV